VVLKTIVVALDGSQMSDKVLEALSVVQIGAETKIILTRVFPPSNADNDSEVDRPHESQELIYQQMEQQLAIYQEKLLAQIDIEIVSGDPAEEIIRLANIYQADLIAIGSRGLKGLERIIGDSVSSQVVTDAPCSILVVK
jgi:nucleotide-binding universal stress UspA family protein